VRRKACALDQCSAVSRPKRKRAHSNDAPPSEHRLVPELVPNPQLWGMSAKKTLGRSAWEQIRLDVLTTAKHACEICGDEPNVYHGDPLNCHEVWHYDDERGVATLIRLRMQCTACDTAVHIGRAIIYDVGDRAFAQLQKVNGISRVEAERLYDTAYAEWRCRSKKTWRLKVADALLAKYPALAQLTER
jgi:hypothetical protein